MCLYIIRTLLQRSRPDAPKLQTWLSAAQKTIEQIEFGETFLENNAFSPATTATTISLEHALRKRPPMVSRDGFEGAANHYRLCWRLIPVSSNNFELAGNDGRRTGNDWKVAGFKRAGWQQTQLFALQYVYPPPPACVVRSCLDKLGLHGL